MYVHKELNITAERASEISESVYKRMFLKDHSVKADLDYLDLHYGDRNERIYALFHYGVKYASYVRLQPKSTPEGFTYKWEDCPNKGRCIHYPKCRMCSKH